MKVEYKCKVCGATKIGIPSHPRNYCSQTCFHADHNRPKRKWIGRSPRACTICGETYVVIASSSSKFCSQKCKDSKLKKPNRICRNCGLHFREFPSNPGYFCSRKCHGESQSKTNVGPNNVRWKGGKEVGRYVKYRHSAKKRGIEYSIGQEEFLSLVKLPCKYCGDDTKPMGLDREDNTKGYVTGNVVPCCKMCNYMKRAYPLDDFSLHIEKIFKFALNSKVPINSIRDSARIGTGSKVWHWSVILDDVVIGDNVNVGSCCEIGRGTVIGDGSRIGFGCFFPPNSKIGKNVFCGPRCTATDDKTPRVNNPHYHAQPPTIHDNAALGAGVVLLPGVVIGEGALIGAGSVVTKDVAPGSVVRGDAARATRMLTATRSRS